jgi:FlaA1/EpsC-like NDP-sugar epimerase
VDEIREIDVEDLLSRPPVAPDESLMQATVLDKSVLVTGAGGSIGSELCRQILRIRPRTLVLFELSELALYTIDKELESLAKQMGIGCRIVPLLGSVQDEARVREIMDHFDVETVYHAAAYKHVPLVEKNIIEGVCNNVLGTLRTARAARDAGVETFVLVSTDKAVSPTSIMGASKRFAELVLQALQENANGTRFAMVRFGNVLESSGSVVPLFRDQIRRGGPVTVTHPEIIRYFMTIPEAAQLVIQAGGMAHGGEVFVLDMGEPVKIRDLAARMIKLMGLTVKDGDNPNGDIEISFTGLRPAEKLYEELLIGENVAGTEHPRIMRRRGRWTAGGCVTCCCAPWPNTSRTTASTTCCGTRASPSRCRRTRTMSSLSIRRPPRARRPASPRPESWRPGASPSTGTAELRPSSFRKALVAPCIANSCAGCITRSTSHRESGCAFSRTRCST